VIAKAATHALASAGLTVSTLSAAILTGLVLGAGTDYALLLIHRYRQELRHHAACEEAMAAALRRTVPTLLASAATVTISMLCLLAAQSAALHGLGPVGAVSIVSALLAEIRERAWWPSRSAPGTASARPPRPPRSPASSTPQDSPQAQHP
jgi:RND superfamily putative drug exporter